MTPEEHTETRPGGWRLSSTTSEYLRSASEQAIEWYPWGTEAFELAKRTNRPILLDVGASWCHWCHVMDEGTYSDGEVARLLRQHFVAVKVDRDQNPEVDRRYQRQVGALTGEGGWPLTAFLTPAGEVFLGGTYFPPQDGLGRPGLRRVLKEVARLWSEEPDKIRGNTTAVRDAIGRMRNASGASSPSSAEFIEAVRSSIHQSFDPVNAGFGMAPKFPHPTAVSFLLWDDFVRPGSRSASRVQETLTHMADGGIYDHVGGGFHRYATDEAWHIPHFEKMGSDNSALLSAYVEGACRFADGRFDATIRGTARWIVEVLGDPPGGFASSQDADNAPGDDGGYFTWSRPELRSILDATELKLVTRFFGVGTEGRMPHDPERNVLFRLLPLAEAAEGLSLDVEMAEGTLARAIEKMASARGQRPTPTVDRALYAHLNGGFVRALAHAGLYLGDGRLLAHARQAADRFIREANDPEQGVAHRIERSGATGFGMLEDQTEMAYGLIELAGATLEPSYLVVARRLLELVDREYRGEDGLLRDLAPRLYDGPKIGSLADPSYPLEDSPHLSANAAVALAWIRLASLTGDESARGKAVELVGTMQGRLRHAGLFAAGTALSAGLLETAPCRIVVEGDGPEAEALWTAARRSWHPNLWAFRGVPSAPFSVPEEVADRGHSTTARALVCFGTRCLEPVTDPTALPKLLAPGRTPAA